MSEFKMLNEIYERLQLEKDVVTRVLDFKNIDYKVGYYPYHTIKKDTDFILEYFPIPVVTIKETIDIGIDLDHIFIEFRLKKEIALNFDFSLFKLYNFEVYGINDYLKDFYLDKDIKNIPNLIEDSVEEEVGVSIYIDKENMDQNFIEAIDFVLEIFEKL